MSTNSSRDVQRKAKRIVVKVGSSLVTNDGRGLDVEVGPQQLQPLLQSLHHPSPHSTFGVKSWPDAE